MIRNATLTKRSKDLVDNIVVSRIEGEAGRGEGGDLIHSPRSIELGERDGNYRCTILFELFRNWQRIGEASGT